MTDSPEIDEVQAAESELDAATQNLVDLEAKFADGDSITPKQFEAAESRKTMAGRMIERMRRVKVMREQAAHDAKVTALHTEWTDWLATDDLAGVRTAYTEYVDAHRALTGRITDYNKIVADFQRRSKSLGVSHGQQHPFPGTPDGFVAVGTGTGPGFNSYPWPEVARHEAEHTRPMDLDGGNRFDTPAVYGHRLHTDARRAELAEQAAQDHTYMHARSAQREADRRAEIAERDRLERAEQAAYDAHARAAGLDR